MKALDTWTKERLIEKVLRMDAVLNEIQQQNFEHRGEISPDWLDSQIDNVKLQGAESPLNDDGPWICQVCQELNCECKPKYIPPPEKPD